MLDRFKEIEDCIAVGQKLVNEQDEQVLLFVKLRSGSLSGDLEKAIRRAIGRSLSPRHVPAQISQVKDIPYTVNGKKIENIVRDIVNGRTTKVSGTAANPECLAEYYQFFQNERLFVGSKL